jgi:DHA1 family bicyclomycin/chloramphenicol resistance-like MFS transporter
MVIFMTIGSLFNARFVRLLGAGRILRVAGDRAGRVPARRRWFWGWIEARYGTIGLWPFLVCMVFQIATMSLIAPNSTAMAMQRYPHMAGTASVADGAS